MLPYLVIGLVSGAIYALVTSGLVVTYRSTGILNFAYGALAFFIGRTYYFFNTQQGWPIWSSAVLSIVVIAPALGAALWWLLFRHLQRVSTIVKVTTTIGLSVALPELTRLLYGSPNITIAPGLAPQPVATYGILGVAVSLDQVIVLLSVIAILALGVVVTKFTRWGLLVRAMVDSRALTAISGINPHVIAVTVWAVTTFLAGLVGVLVGPVIGADSTSYTELMAISFAAVVLAKLTHIGRAVAFSVLIGIVTSILRYWLPPTSLISSGMLAAIPFAFLLVFLLWNAFRLRGNVRSEAAAGGALDQAIQASGERRTAKEETAMAQAATRLHDIVGRRVWNQRSVGGMIPLVVALIIPFLLSSYWLGLFGEGFSFACIFLSFTLVIGEGGMTVFCLVSFAGLGAVLTGFLVTSEHWPFLVACLVAALAVVPGGLIIGVLTTRLGDLYVAVVTLVLAFLLDNIVFPLDIFSHGDPTIGVTVDRPGWASTNLALALVALAVFCLLALSVEHCRRSTAGLAVTAVRWSEAGARSVGLPCTQVKVILLAQASFIAAFGGGLLAVVVGEATPVSFSATTGMVLLAVVVSVGVHSNAAALLAGLAYAVLSGVFLTYLPTELTPIPLVLFGLGAMMLSRNPEGALLQFRRYVVQALAAIRSRVASSPSPGTDSGRRVDEEPQVGPVPGDTVFVAARSEGKGR
jgi:branched-chain amino acid transport system permease protein